MSTRQAYALAVRQYRTESRRLVQLEPGANPWPFLTIARHIANHWDVAQRPAMRSEFWQRASSGPMAGRRLLAGPTLSGRRFFARLP